MLLMPNGSLQKCIIIHIKIIEKKANCDNINETKIHN